jgi:hypothetical protein
MVQGVERWIRDAGGTQVPREVMGEGLGIGGLADAPRARRVVVALPQVTAPMENGPEEPIGPLNGLPPPRRRQMIVRKIRRRLNLGAGRWFVRAPIGSCRLEPVIDPRIVELHYTSTTRRT